MNPDAPELLLLVAVAVLAACGGGGDSDPPTGPPDGGPDAPEVAAVAVTPDSATLTSSGETLTFQATVTDRSGDPVPGASVSWHSSDGSVVEVDDGGRATARANGAARVVAAASGVEGFARVAVRGGELGWREIRAGLINSCGVTTHGTAFCWGDNAHGQIGNGETSQVHPPARVRGGVLYFETFAIGGGQTCALTFQREAYCWGNTSFGEGGFGENDGAWLPVTRVSGGHAFRQITAGGNHTCGVTTEDVAYCWGLNSQGQLGDGTTTNRNRPVEVTGGHAFVQISAGPASTDNHTCAVTTGGAAYCWGVNRDGELGDGTTTPRLEPVEVEGGLTFAEIAAGGTHTCGITPEGAAWCWGAGGGQLGNGTDEPTPSPVEVSGGHRFREITAGNGFTCAVTTDGGAYCWGSNSLGQLGDGTTQERRVPVAVAGGLEWVQLDAGVDHVCGAATDGTGYCWGSATASKLGDAPGNQSAPYPMPHPGEIR